MGIPAADAPPKANATMLEQYLVALTPAAKQARAELPRAPDAAVAGLAIRINVENTMRSILEVSKPLRQQWESGDLMIEGGIYDITTGKVEFIGGPQNVGNLRSLEPVEQLNFTPQSNPFCQRCSQLDSWCEMNRAHAKVRLLV